MNFVSVESSESVSVYLMRKVARVFGAAGSGAAMFLAVGIAAAESEPTATPQGITEQTGAEKSDGDTPIETPVGEDAASDATPNQAATPPSFTTKKASGVNSVVSSHTLNADTEDDYLIESLIAEHPEWECEYRAHARTERHLVLGCQGGLIITLSETRRGVSVTARRQVDGEVTEFFERKGAVWARFTVEGAEFAVPGRILSSGNSFARHRSDGVREEWDITGGVVSQVEGRDVVVELGEGHNLRSGDRMALWRPLGEDDLLKGEAPVVGTVVRVSQGRALIRLGLNEMVEVGYEAQVTAEPETASRRRPPRAFDLWDVRAALRPVLSTGSMGGGVSGEFEVGRRTEFFRYGVHIMPLSLFAARRETTLFAGSGYVFGAMDQPLFSVGMGIGVATINDTDRYSPRGTGTSLVQLLRLGAVDGVYIESRVEAVVFRSEILLGYLQLTGQLPVGDSMWIVARAGGGRLGYGFGEVVMRRLLWGNGGAGSVFWELGWGGATMFEEVCPRTNYPDADSCYDTSLMGPMLVGAMNWRM